ncbi:heme lyase CcmF/NrfE family subunit [Alphaproteobacteria bacterium]|nr:heme lyase CcmF/NrfE family subunit [Alphaproteobacteria bacterium]MDA8780432.1 heme lyase CcmF/NrfE family subunit [Alphaproteobacteria bacterium]MDA9591045.1 heme lyase CcmF/NrfE family subunit [Alphaproteobacteria bacterium]MDB2406183.1 heme lyase CcmF/NrfE family subunit [Alphaproteobacteria bacterium]MDB2432193.1 heme lyase CcmF/NrfE family subunit [Alphaproteobacteria bacterium]
MIAELGHFVLVLALVVAAVQAIAPIYLARTAPDIALSIASRASYLQFILILLAFAALSYGFVRSDFSLAVVFANSHVAKPLIYKIAGVWGNHEGSMLLWVLIVAAYGAAYARFTDTKDSFAARVLIVQGWLGVAFLAFLLFTSNPFARLLPAPFSGQGLTPILQDPALAAHPPLLYAGYVGFSMAYAFALAALTGADDGGNWARRMRPWILTAWIFLTLGIALGSYWAYYELGWGGFWFWDPVENASLMPWLAGTALLHSALVAEKRDTLKKWTLLLAIITFALSLSGTFLVRSGVLTSVHAFANDPERGLFILAILGGFSLAGFVLYGLRLPRLAADKPFQPVSREGLLLVNNIFLATATVTVFLGTIYPLVLDALGMGKISVGAPYFNAVFAPLTIPFALLLPLGPLLNWRAGSVKPLQNRLLLAAGAAALVTCGIVLSRGAASVMVVALFAAALWLLFGAGLDLAQRLAPYRSRLIKFWTLPANAFSAPLAHAGLAVMLLGILAATQWRAEIVVAAAPNQQVNIAGISLRYDGLREIDGPNYRAEQARLTYLTGRHQGTHIFPERRFYEAERAQTTEAAITTDMTGHLYAVVGETSGDKRVLRLWYHPYVAFIWLGALLMALGGSFALVTRLGRA